MALKRISEPDITTIDVDDAKAQMRVDHHDDDLLIANLIKAATLHVQDNAGRQFLPATYRLTLDRFPAKECGLIELAVCPVRSVESVQYVDPAGNLLLLGPSAYQVDAESEPGRLLPAYGTSWPTTRPVVNAVTVEFVAGYSDPGPESGAQMLAVPENAKRLIILLATHWYENPSAVMTGTISKEIELAYTSLLWDLKWGIDA